MALNSLIYLCHTVSRRHSSVHVERSLRSQFIAIAVRHKGTSNASLGSSYAPVQRRAVPQDLEGTLPDADKDKTSRRQVMSVAELHVVHCEKLAKSPPRGGTAVIDASWDWAGLRACKMADVMKPNELARCASAFAQADRRDFRLSFVLAEEAISKTKDFGPLEASAMMKAYARSKVRNEPLFEAFGNRLLSLIAEEPWTEVLDEAVCTSLAAYEDLDLHRQLAIYSAIRDAAREAAARASVGLSAQDHTISTHGRIRNRNSEYSDLASRSLSEEKSSAKE
eukprot:TRINITY_DN67787_c0_g1_i1.p1 TRINITY_DN67787_c0_g1~~TRINITY_DN67787_c0_g1_i1.p1  ORF type:complete len:281 (+),score=53.26 TRINITY_DN67787_c0_g1_i1:84-926(+)